jgi:GTP-dependent dephospho-CoA kinase
MNSQKKKNLKVLIPPDILKELKKPLGKLILDSDITEKKIRKEIDGLNRKIITIGDRSTERFISFDIFPNLAIIDGVERRQDRSSILPDKLNDLKAKGITRISCINPAGYITHEAVTKIKFALSVEKNFVLQVVGEEDLLTLPVCYFATRNSVVCYGQPLKGLVIIKVNDSIRRKAKELMKSINNKLLTGYDDVVAV